MGKLTLIILLAIATGFFTARILRNKPSDAVIENDEGQSNRKVILILLLCIISTIMILFVLPRFGISIGALIQKLLAFLPLLRGLLPL